MQLLLQGHGARGQTVNLFCRTCTQPPASSYRGGLNSLEVWVILMELVEVVSIPVGNTNNSNGKRAKSAQRAEQSQDRKIALLSTESGAVSANTLAPRGLVQHLKEDHSEQARYLNRDDTEPGAPLETDIPGTPNSAGIRCRRKQ